VEAEMVGAKVPHRRGVTTDLAVSIDAARVPSRGMFGEATDGDALDALLRALVERRVLYWEGPPPGPDERPETYSFKHKSGVAVTVTAHGG